MYGKLSRRADELRETLIACRRDLHKYAETGWLEMRTASLVAGKLHDLGYEVLMGPDVCKPDARMGVPSNDILDRHYEWAKIHGADSRFLPCTKDGFTGVIGILRCGEGPVVAMRFDMDALHVLEEEGTSHKPAREGFSSVTKGIMHACGHDGHVTIGLGTASLLSEIKSQLSGTIKLIFQPAEEGVQGAKSIVAHGHLDDADYVMGSHLLPSADGEYHICPGLAGTLATTKLNAFFSGKSAHAGLCPQDGKNALLAAATAVLNIHALPRHKDGTSRVNVGVLHAGTARNVICDHARLELEVRGQTQEINSYLEQYTRNILQCAAAMHGCTLKTEVMGSASSVECTENFAERIRTVCKNKLQMNVIEPYDIGFSEDFACMTQRAIENGKMACFTGIQIPCTASLHNNQFDFDENALTIGVKYYTGIVWDLLGKSSDIR